MTSRSELKRMAECAMGFTNMSLAPDVVLGLIEEIDVADKIIAERNRLLDAIPACPVHGQCVPHAIEWVEKSMLVMRELKAENDSLRCERTDWQAECLKKGFEYMRESDDHYVLADVPEMAELLGQLLGVEVRDKENDSYGETVSSLSEQIDAANNAFHRAYEAEKERDELRKIVAELRQGANCRTVHHCRAEQHEFDEPCKVLARIDAAIAKGSADV